MNREKRWRAVALVASIVAVGALVTIITLGVRGVGRLVPRSTFETIGRRVDRSGNTNDIAVPFELPESAEFQSISVVGGWRLTVNEGDFDVVVTSSDRASPDVRVFLQGGSLHLEAPVTLDASDMRLNAAVTMPTLSRVSVAGGADVQIDRIEGERLDLSVDGAASVRATGSRFEDLRVTVRGAANIDFRNSHAVNADVQLDGASNLSVHMAGGRLTGTMRGVANVTWTGSASEESVRLEGIGRVRRQ